LCVCEKSEKRNHILIKATRLDNSTVKEQSINQADLSHSPSVSLSVCLSGKRIVAKGLNIRP